MRFASSMPRSKLTLGRTLASANATPSNVLWWSLRTITRQPSPEAPPRPRLGRFRVGVAGTTVTNLTLPRLGRIFHFAGSNAFDFRD
jgi:hypothetical protein